MQGAVKEGEAPRIFAYRVLPLFLSAALLLGANGLSVTAIAIAARTINLGDAMVGLIGSSYYAGFVAGVVLTPVLLARVGHIRVFATLASTSAIAVLVLVLLEAPLLWLAARFVSGIAFCGSAMVLESWLNSMAGNAARGRVLSIYRVIDLGTVSSCQFLLIVYPPGSAELFVAMALMFAAALVPLSLTREANPDTVAPTGFPVARLWTISPVAAAGVFVVGLTNSAFRAVGPIYSQDVGLSLDQLAQLVALWVLAGAVLQYPLGWISDRVDRRYVLIFATFGASAACFLLYSTSSTALVFVGGILFGGFGLPLYSLAAAHAYDHAARDQYVVLAAGLILFFAIGGMLGPLFASLVIDIFGVRSFFLYFSALHSVLIVFTLVRMTSRGPVPPEARGRFVWLLRTTPAIFRFAMHRLDGHKRRERAGRGPRP